MMEFQESPETLRVELGSAREVERLRTALAELLGRVEAHQCEKWFPHVVERARAALDGDVTD